MLRNEKVFQAVSDPLNTPHSAPASDFLEVHGRLPVIAFFLGMAVIAAAIFLGRSYTFFIAFPIFALLMTLLWGKTPWPWILLVSVSAATPIAVSRYQFACNLIFAISIPLPWNGQVVRKPPPKSYVSR